MKKGIKYIFVPFLVILVAVAIALGSYVVFAERNLAFEPITEKTLDISSVNERVKWFTISDNNFEKLDLSDYAEKAIINQLDSELIDTDNYTYIVTIGHRLKGFSYNYTRCSLRRFIIPTEYIGRATLESQSTGKVYVYKIRKMNIDRDYHGGEDFELL